ncbi:GntR family transcriptional regulator [Rhodococcus sp. HNM0569]|uniref:GntR family transcriptional regulator n=1 Tax=Rhodococcus sp. HNM0569 TaxID=2716340 RepID=UPI00146F6BF1|nr:GntR family transcriptional regulator [Rhodococcus sp. HNM0569]NLU82068.1 GntR family transcriptional regulator [Rhodococcus sp. HNM0569]
MLHADGRQSAAEHVYRDVKERILSGVLPGGELISEGEIAGRLGVSRTPVREAFLKLETEGWMRLYPKRGALVVPVAEGEAQHIADARRLVETHAVAQVALQPRVREQLVARLRESLDEQHEIARSGDVAAFSAADADFHTLVVAAGDNPLLDAFYVSLRERQRRMTARSLARDPHQLPRIIDDHARLADLVERGEVDGFDVALRMHMEQVHALNPKGAQQ